MGGDDGLVVVLGLAVAVQLVVAHAAVDLDRHKDRVEYEFNNIQGVSENVCVFCDSCKTSQKLGTPYTV